MTENSLVRIICINLDLLDMMKLFVIMSVGELIFWDVIAHSTNFKSSLESSHYLLSHNSHDFAQKNPQLKVKLSLSKTPQNVG